MSTPSRPRARRHLPSRLPSREELIQKTKDRLLRHGLPRLQMTILVALTGAAGFLASYALLHAGLGSMAVRYPLAVVAAYGVFLLLLRIWLVLQERGWGEMVDAGDVVDLADGALEVAGGAADSFSGGGGGFGGAGASTHFDQPVSLSLPATPRSSVSVPRSGGKGSGFNFSLDLDESGCLVLAALGIMALAAMGTAIWLVWTGPALLAEVLVDGLLMAGLYRRLKRREETSHWLIGAVRRTWIPALVTAVLFAVAGGLLHRAVPEARSIGAAWKAVTAEKETGRRP